MCLTLTQSCCTFYLVIYFSAGGDFNIGSYVKGLKKQNNKELCILQTSFTRQHTQLNQGEGQDLTVFASAENKLNPPSTSCPGVCKTHWRD